MCGNCGRILVIGDWPWPCTGDGDHSVHGGDRIRAIHTSERTVILRNPRTGEIRFPARADQPMHWKYARAGYERVELTNAQSVSEFERSSGRLHERSHYDPGSGRSERELTAHCEDQPGDPAPLPDFAD